MVVFFQQQKADGIVSLIRKVCPPENFPLTGTRYQKTLRRLNEVTGAVSSKNPPTCLIEAVTHVANTYETLSPEMQRLIDEECAKGAQIIRALEELQKRRSVRKKALARA